MRPLDAVIVVAFAIWALSSGLRARRVASQNLDE